MLIRPDAKVFLGLHKLSTKNKKEIIELIEGILTLPICLYIKPEFFSTIKNLNLDSRAKLVVCEDPEKESMDMILILENQYLKLIKKGIVPIVESSLAKKNDITEFDPLSEKGIGFLFEKENKWNIFSALIKALENYKFPYDWENISKKCKRWNYEQVS